MLSISSAARVSGLTLSAFTFFLYPYLRPLFLFLDLNIFKMRSFALFSAAVAACVSGVNAATTVTGAAEGFAKGVTGGGSATAVYPTTNAELVSYLGDSSARVIVLTKT